MSSNKITYTQINNFTSNDDYNFFGIIYDATFPTLEDNPNTYICSVKVIDYFKYESTKTQKIQIDQVQIDEMINLVIKSTSKENLPYIHCIGDIIRVHRGVYVLFLLIFLEI